MEKLLGMMGSAHDGEALNAARLADRMVQESGLTWTAILHPAAPVRPACEPPMPPTVFAHVDVAQWALSFSRHLSPWERDFCTTIAARPGRLTPKQSLSFARIIADLEAKTGRRRTR